MAYEAPPANEQQEVADIFAALLKSATGDGGTKRASGEKPSWKVDPSHEAAIFSHLSKWKHGELVDADSGVHPLVHLAWRALAIAWQETQTRGTVRDPRWYNPQRKEVREKDGVS